MRKYWLRSCLRDGINFFRFGPLAPRFAECIWVDPTCCDSFIPAAEFKRRFSLSVRKMSGAVADTWPDDLERSLDENPVFVYCLAHWQGGRSWTEAGAIDFMLQNIASASSGSSDGCRNLEDVIKRFDALDSAWSDVLSSGKLMSRKELLPSNFREYGGIVIHLGPDGRPVFSGAGNHRFAMAKILNRPFPAQIGCVHISALPHLDQFRERPDLT
ncbi:hypothetical protein LGV61_01345 [Desulfurispirillum indicum]|nr:hypothetical protein [Desulfurispirillum indicum]UCZ56947.1 hypothetical protein LGV61_01345 [Desulfurispirillum indicum]